MSKHDLPCKAWCSRAFLEQVCRHTCQHWCPRKAHAHQLCSNTCNRLNWKPVTAHIIQDKKNYECTTLSTLLIHIFSAQSSNFVKCYRAAPARAPKMVLGHLLPTLCATKYLLDHLLPTLCARATKNLLGHLLSTLCARFRAHAEDCTMPMLCACYKIVTLIDLSHACFKPTHVSLLSLVCHAVPCLICVGKLITIYKNVITI